MHKLLFLVSLWLIAFTCSAQTVSDLVTATQNFISTVPQDQKESLLQPLNHRERTQWTNLPVGIKPRPGLRYGDINEKGKMAFHEILTTLFSSQGYLKITSIMELDDILNLIYKQAFEAGKISNDNYAEIKDLDWESGNYFVTVWGEPSESEPWGLKLGGHHISINLTVADNNFSLSPLFLGTDPAEVRTTKHAGLRVLSKEEDYGLRLMHSLNTEQRKKATLSHDVPRDIISNPDGPQRIDDFYGIPSEELSSKQRILLTRIILEYLNNMEFEKVEILKAKIGTDLLAGVHFAWIGSYERRKSHYYLINGPKYMIEYDNYGFSGDGNHIHSIWRMKDSSFGEDILKLHYENHAH